MKVTVEQLCELFQNIRAGRISREALQGLLDDTGRIGLEQLLKDLIRKARTVASEIPDAYWKSRAFSAIAEAYAKTGDFEAARTVASEIPDAYWKSRAFSAIAEAIAKVLSK